MNLLSVTYTYGTPDCNDCINRIVIDVNEHVIKTLKVDCAGTKQYIDRVDKTRENKQVLHLLNLTKDGFEFIEIKDKKGQLVEVDGKQFYLVEKE